MDLEHQQPQQFQTTKQKSYHLDHSYFRENMSIEYALRDGVVSNWDHLEKIWDHALASSIKVDIKETPVLLAEKSYNSSISRQK
jgi:actin-related protein